MNIWAAARPRGFEASRRFVDWSIAPHDHCSVRFYTRRLLFCWLSFFAEVEKEKSQANWFPFNSLDFYSKRRRISCVLVLTGTWPTPFYREANWKDASYMLEVGEISPNPSSSLETRLKKKDKTICLTAPNVFKPFVELLVLLASKRTKSMAHLTVCHLGHSLQLVRKEKEACGLSLCNLGHLSQTIRRRSISHLSVIWAIHLKLKNKKKKVYGSSFCNLAQLSHERFVTQLSVTWMFYHELLKKNRRYHERFKSVDVGVVCAKEEKNK